MSHWMNSPTMEAAALEGVSENLAYPLDERLKCAQRAIALLRGHIEELEAAARKDERIRWAELFERRASEQVRADGALLGYEIAAEELRAATATPGAEDEDR